MSLPDLQRRLVPTRLGPLPLLAKAEAFHAQRPMVLALNGLFGARDLIRVPDVLGIYADGALLPLHEIAAEDLSVDTLAGAVADLIAATFPNRPVVLLGVSIGATVCLAVRSPALARVVAVEPILSTENLWPLPLKARRDLPGLAADAREHLLWSRLLGATADHIEPRDYRAVLDGLAVPTNVILGGVPLQPQRDLATLPSLVDDSDRRRLAAHPRVRLHTVPGVGHNVQGREGRVVVDILVEACRRAAAVRPYDVRQLDEPLLEAAPLGVARLVHWGPGAEAFQAAYLARSPKTQVEVLGGSTAAAPGFDVLALAAVPDPHTLATLAAGLSPAGQVIVRGTLDTPPTDTAGLVLAPTSDPTIVRLRRAGAPGEPQLRVHMAAVSPLLMDIRTRLPAQMLAATPDLQVTYLTPPMRLPPPDAPPGPKVLVLQRLGETDLAYWRRLLAKAIAADWVVVTEYDDHPYVVADVLGRPRDEDQMRRFAWVHAVQTSTPPLVDAFRPFNPEIALFENAVFELLPFPDRDGPRRIFYGGVLRGRFPVDVAAALRPVSEEFPDAEFVVIGDRAVFDALPARAKSFAGYMSYEAYLAEMASCLVSLSPMEAAPLRDTKSDAKYLDGARAGVLTIASPPTYERTIQHGVNGLLARELTDWPDLLGRALREPDWRRAIARRAWEEVRERRMFAGQVEARRALYWSLWNRRGELTEALCGRLPGLREELARRSGA